MERKERELLRVYDQEGQHKTLAVLDEITCAEVVALFGKKVHGFQASQFQLCVDYKGVKSNVNQLSFPYSIAKELEADALDDKDRKTGVSKVKFYLVDTKSAESEGFPKYEPTHSFIKKTNEVPRRPSQVFPRKTSDSAILRKLSEVPPRRASDGTTPRKNSGSSRKYSGESSSRKNSDGIKRKNSSSSLHSSGEAERKSVSLTKPHNYHDKQELAAYLLKRNVTAPDLALAPVWAFFRPSTSTHDPVLTIFENRESSEPISTIHLKDAKYDLQTVEEFQFPFLTITLPNSDKHFFTAETIAEWHDALRHATKICKPQSPSLVFAQPRSPATNKRGSVTPSSVVNANELLKRRTLNGLVITPFEPQPRDHAISAWVNFCCSKPVILSPETMIEDMHSGVVLAHLVEMLFESKVFTNTGNSEDDFKYNVTLCLDVLRILGVPTSGLSTSDVLECKQPRPLLTLLWSMFFYFVAGTEEPATQERIIEWAKSSLGTNYESKGLMAIDIPRIQDGTVYAALLHKFHPDCIDFDAVVKHEKDVRLDIVFISAEQKLRIPKLIDKAALIDERVSMMYLSLLYLALADSYKWDDFVKRIKPIKQIIPLAPISVNIPEAKPKEAAKIPRKQSAASKANALKAEESKESTTELLSNIKLKHVTKAPSSKAPPPPSVPVLPQLKKTAKIAPLLVAEGFQSGGSGIARAKKPAAAKPVAKPAAAKPGAKPGHKSATSTAPKSESASALVEPKDAAAEAKDATGADEHADPAVNTTPVELREGKEQRKEPERTEPQRADPERTEPGHAEPLRTEPDRTEPQCRETERTENERTEPECTQHEHTEPEHKELEHTEPIHKSEGHVEHKQVTSLAAAPTDFPTEAPVGVAIFDPLLSTLAEAEKKEVTTIVGSTTSTSVYDAATSSVTEPTPAQSTEPPQKTEDNLEEDSDTPYDDDSGSDSGGDMEYSQSRILRRAQPKNVQVEFQKDMKTREGRINEMKRWRASSALPPPDELGPILSHEQAIRAGHVIEDNDLDAREKYGREPSFSARLPLANSASTPTQQPLNNGSGADDKDKNNITNTTSNNNNIISANTNNTNETITSDKNSNNNEFNKEKDDKDNISNNKDNTEAETNDKINEEENEKEKEKENNRDISNDLKDTKDEKNETQPPGSKDTQGTQAAKQTEAKEEVKGMETTRDTNKESDNKEKKDKGKAPERLAARPPKVVIRVTLEGFGETQFRSFAIDPKTVAGDVCSMVAQKMKFTEIQVPEYGLFVVKNGLERLLDSDEEVMTAEVSVEKFVYKRNYENEGDRDRNLFLSLHRSQPFKFQK